MSYAKQNFVSKQRLTAAHVNHIEDGIVAIERMVEGIEIPETLPNPHSLTIGDVTYDGSKDVSIDLNSGRLFNNFYTDLSRTKHTVTVNCYGLVPGEEYAIHLYTASRRRGNSKGAWRHPCNTNTGAGFTGKGYARLAGHKFESNKNSDIVYPPVPDWMPNDGILQTEWTFVATKTTEHVMIELATWFLPMLKPIKADWSNGYSIIGVSINKESTALAPLLMQFKIVNKATGEVGSTVDTLRVGRHRLKNLSVESEMGIGYYMTGLYASIV